MEQTRTLFQSIMRRLCMWHFGETSKAPRIMHIMIDGLQMSSESRFRFMSSASKMNKSSQKRLNGSRQFGWRYFKHCFANLTPTSTRKTANEPHHCTVLDMVNQALQRSFKSWSVAVLTSWPLICMARPHCI